MPTLDFVVMTRSELISCLSNRHCNLSREDAEASVAIILEAVVSAIAAGDRVEIRGFGSFASHERPARVGRNPKTGESVSVPAKRVPQFKTGKALREGVDRTSDPAPSIVPALRRATVEPDRE